MAHETKSRVYVLAAVAGLALALGWWLTGGEGSTRAGGEAEAAAQGPATKPRVASPSAEPSPATAPAAAEPVRAPEPSAEVAVEPPPRNEAARARERAHRDALRERIVAAQRARLGDDDDEPEALGQLPKEYLRQRVRDDLIPLAKECYDMALDDDEELAGRLVFQFRIVGEPELGGIVEDAQPTPDSDITHPDMVECMREAMMSMSFDPPENGGAVEVTYPFEFLPG
jgi:hypothetical protein